MGRWGKIARAHGLGAQVILGTDGSGWRQVIIPSGLEIQLGGQRPSVQAQCQGHASWGLSRRKLGLEQLGLRCRLWPARGSHLVTATLVSAITRVGDQGQAGKCADREGAMVTSKTTV